MNVGKKLNQYRYAILNKGMTFENAYCFCSKFEKNIEILARIAADDYLEGLACEDGWFPGDLISIELFKEDGTSLGIFDTEYPFTPNFTVTPKEQSNLSCSS